LNLIRLRLIIHCVLKSSISFFRVAVTIIEDLAIG
jgi:hypothetical protein